MDALNCKFVVTSGEKLKPLKNFMKKYQIVLTGACFFRSGLPTKQSKTTFDPACAHISVLFLPIKRLLVFFVKPSGS